MNTKNYINYHVLISHSPSCLNRDDMNMQKTAVFGGRKRIRISSQSLKRAMRKSGYYAERLGDPSVRTRDLEKLKARCAQLLEGRYDEKSISQALEWMSGKEGIADADAVGAWSVEEIAYFCQLIQEGKKKGMDAAKLEKQIEKESRPFREAMGKAVDIALSGRMATSGLMTNLPVDGALAMAHAITTHAVEPQDVDWFTAVDDLTQDAGETGAGHLNTQEFSSGVFYRYASLNLKQLQFNLGLVDSMEAPETAESRKRALEIAKHVFHMLATVVPEAKRQPFAADNPADFALVSFADMPVSLANAFETPVAENGGYLQPSIKEMISYWKALTDFHALKENAAAASLRPADFPDNLRNLKSLAALEQWIENDAATQA